MAIQNFVEDFISGLRAGQQEKQAKQAELNRAEDRKLEKLLLQHKLREIGIQEKLQARNLAKDNFSLFEGRPASEFPVSGMNAQGASPSGLPGGIPNLTPQRAPQPMTIPGVEELGVGDVQMTPRTMEDLLKAQAQAKLNEPFNLAPGARRFQGGQVVAENPAAPRPANLQTIETVIGGQPTMATFNPQTGEVKPIAGARPYEAPRASGAAAGGSSLVDTVMANPAMYHTLTPTTREKIAPELAARGFTQFEKSSKPNDGSVSEAAETAAEVKRIAKALREHPGLPGVFGTVSSRLPTFRQSTADAEVLLESLQGLLTLDNMGKMKGVLSDSDMKVLRQASTTLNAKMSEAAAKAELLRLESVLKKVEGALDIGATGSGNRIGRFEVVIK